MRSCILWRVLSLLLLTLLAPPVHAKKPAPPPAAAWKATDDMAEEQKTGMTALVAGDWAAAETAFSAVLAKEPECGQALAGLGRALVMLGRPAEALPHLQKASALFADQVDAHLWHAKAAAATGAGDVALAEAKAVLAQKPGHLDAQRVAQGVLRDQKAFADAHTMIATARAAANNPGFDCLEGVVFALEDKLGDATRMTTTCSGVPDQTLYTELTRAITEAVARAEAAAPPPPPEPPPPPPPEPPKKKK